LLRILLVLGRQLTRRRRFPVSHLLLLCSRHFDLSALACVCSLVCVFACVCVLSAGAWDVLFSYQPTIQFIYNLKNQFFYIWYI
jgi:hypothetical protein